MLKFIVSALILFLIVLFWEKINETIYKKIRVRINYIILIITLLTLGTIVALLYY